MNIVTFEISLCFNARELGGSLVDPAPNVVVPADDVDEAVIGVATPI